MRIKECVNNRSNQWELIVSDFVKGAFVLGDKLYSKFSEETRTPDAGHAIVIGINNADGILLVDGGNTGWIGTDTHVLFRRSSCDCICHSFDERFGR